MLFVHRQDVFLVTNEQCTSMCSQDLNALYKLNFLYSRNILNLVLFRTSIPYQKLELKKQHLSPYYLLTTSSFHVTSCSQTWIYVLWGMKVRSLNFCKLSQVRRTKTLKIFGSRGKYSRVYIFSRP